MNSMSKLPKIYIFLNPNIAYCCPVDHKPVSIYLQTVETCADNKDSIFLPLQNCAKQ